MRKTQLYRIAFSCSMALLALSLSAFASPTEPESEEAVTVVSDALVQGNGEGTADVSSEELIAEELDELADAVDEELDETLYGIVTGGTINVRTGPSTSHSKITTIQSGHVVSIEGSENGWYKISFDGVTGYIHGDYLRESVDASSPIGTQAAALAHDYIGVPYSWGGSSPRGFDCSGLTMYLYAQYGYSLPHTATGQYKNCGSYVAKENLQPGDLVFFSQRGYAIGHVGIYIGDGAFIHARSSTHRVQIDWLNSSYYSSHYVGAKRIV